MTIHTQTVAHLAGCAQCQAAAARIIGATGGRAGGRSNSPAKKRASRANLEKARRTLAEQAQPLAPWEKGGAA